MTATEPTDARRFRVEVFLNRYLPAGNGSVDVIVKVTAGAGDTPAHSELHGRVLPDLRLQVWTPLDGTVESARQVGPEVVDLPAGTYLDDDRMWRELPLGDWAPGEDRHYHLRLRVPPQEAGEEGLAGELTLVLGLDRSVAEAPITVQWTDNRARSARIDPHVARYTGRTATGRDTMSLESATRTVRIRPRPHQQQT